MQKFFVAGMPRTGSTLLATTLDQHSNIKMFGELFHPVVGERSGPHAMIDESGRSRFFEPDKEDAIEFLRKEVWTPAALEKNAVGFKLFGEYLKVPATNRLFLRIVESFPDVKLVTIWRENLFDCLISRQVARATGKWMESAKSRPTDAPTAVVTITPSAADNFFKGYSDVKRFLDILSEKMPYFAVSYDALTQNFEGLSADLFDFLALEQVPVRQAIRKQAQFSQSEYVENWDELQDYFKDTEYASYFVG